MFNLNGEVIGIVSHIKSMSGGSDGIGYATSSIWLQIYYLIIKCHGLVQIYIP